MKYIFPKHIVTMNRNFEILSGTGIEISGGKITGVVKKEDMQPGAEIYDYPDYVMLPGFIQPHVHLCQTLFRGLADDMPLLDWLKKRIFPLENNHTAGSLRASAKIGLCELQKSGTTTIMDMGTLNHQEVIFEEMISSGMRGYAGKCMMDRNDLYPAFKETTEETFKRSIEYAEAFHNSADGRVKYAFAPRFVLSCSEKLLKDTYEALTDFDGALFHTHSSENKDEIKTVKSMTGLENIEYFEKIGVLSEKTVLAHCIHLNEKEKILLKERETAVAHCPSSNMKLGSGRADIPEYLKRGIKVSIAADGAPCNNNLSQLVEMRLASLIQKPVYGPEFMDARTVLRLATIGGAEALGIGNETGSIETGKFADIVLFDLNKLHNSLDDSPENIYSDIVYSADRSNIKEVLINGKQVVKNSGSVIFDEEKIINSGRSELKTIVQKISF